MSKPSSSPLVLLTGITGFLANHVLNSLLASPAKYRVRGTLRSMSKKNALLERLGSDASRVELVQVDATETSDLSEAIKGVTHIAHVASPFQLQVENIERDLLTPAIEGTLNILRFAKRETSVEKVAITSSFAAITNFPKGGPNRPGYVYTKQDWNPFDRQDAKGPFAYAVSKKLAEKAAWDFVEREKPHFELATFNPPVLYGQTLQPGVTHASLNLSNRTIYDLISSADSMPDDRLPLFCHASDAAEAHVRWLSSNTASAQRYLLYGGHFNWAMAVEYIAKTRPELIGRLPKGYKEAIAANTNDPKTLYALMDCTPAEEELDMTFKDWKQTLDDSLDSLLRLEKNKDWK